MKNEFEQPSQAGAYRNNMKILEEPAPSVHRRFDEKIEGLEVRLDEVIKLINLKTEKLTVKTKILEERLEDMAKDSLGRFHILNSRLSDISKAEIKLQEVDDRYSLLIRTLENRLQHFKRLHDEQSLLVQKLAGELDEARRDIARLKGRP